MTSRSGAKAIRRLPLSKRMRACLRTASSFISSNTASRGTGNLVVRRSDFDKVGPFRGIEVAEDIDWGQRARAAGYTFLYVPEMIVFHPARQSLRELFVKWDRHIQHAVNTGGKNVMWQARWVLRAFAILISPVIDWTKVIASDRIHGVSARIKAIFVLVRGTRVSRIQDDQSVIVEQRGSCGTGIQRSARRTFIRCSLKRIPVILKHSLHA